MENFDLLRGREVYAGAGAPDPQAGRGESKGNTTVFQERGSGLLYDGKTGGIRYYIDRYQRGQRRYPAGTEGAGGAATFADHFYGVNGQVLSGRVQCGSRVFLKKPIEPVFLMKALNKAGSRLQDLKKSYLVISNKQGIYKIPLYTILCFESEKRKIHVYTQDREISYYGKFEDLKEKLDPRFVRCHNSYIVNLTKVCELSEKKFVCENGKSIPISKTYYIDVREKFLSYLDGGEFCGGTPLGAHA